MKPSEQLTKHRAEIQKIMNNNKYFCNLRVFGSVVNGTDTEDSDIDFLVDAKEEYSFFNRCDLQHQLEDLLNVEIDLVVESTLKPSIKKKLLQVLPV